MSRRHETFDEYRARLAQNLEDDNFTVTALNACRLPVLFDIPTPLPWRATHKHRLQEAINRLLRR